MLDHAVAPHRPRTGVRARSGIGFHAPVVVDRARPAAHVETHGERLGITGPQRLVLRVVGQFPGLSASELAHIVRLHPSTITGILQRLVARGLLERQRDPADTRRARLHLKAKAAPHTRSSRGTVEKAVTEALEHAGASNVRAARKVLIEIARRLNVL